MIFSNGALVPSQIDTIGDATPIFADASYYSTNAMPLTGTWAAYGGIYQSQVWVNTIIRKLAFATARLPFDIKRQGDGNNQAPEPGALADLMNRPNDRIDQFKLWLWTSSTYDIYGEAFWLKIRDNNGKVRELHPMHPTNVIIRRDPDTASLWYIYSAGVRNVALLPPIPEADVVPFINYNPLNLVRGWSNLEPLRQTLLNEDSSRRATASWWARGARPSLMISAPQALSQPAYDRLQAKVGMVHGGVDNAGGTLVLEEGAKPVPVQLSSEEMQYIESRKLNREEVCAAYDVPPPVVHILDKATFSNITEQMRSMYRDTMAPRLGLFESIINHHLVPDFDTSGDVFTRFNLDDVMRGDFETRATAAVKLVQSGLLKPAEGRPMFNLPDAGPVADRLYANAAIQELGSPAEAIRITAGTPANPIPETPAEAEDVQGAENSASRADRQADEQNGGPKLRQLTGSVETSRAVRRKARRARAQNDQETA